MVFSLLITWAALLFGGFIFSPADPYLRMPLWTRLASSVVLVLLSCVLALRSPSLPFLLLAIGMSLGFLGDCFMADLFAVSFPHVLGGMAAFGAGHIAYIAAGLVLGVGVPIGGRLIAWVIWLFLGGIGWYAAVWRPAQEPGVLHRAALPYALLLASTAGIGSGLALNRPAFWLFAIGGALFLISDLLIALDLFNDIQFSQMGDWVWLTYGPAQALILLVMWF
ncbi:MAG: lysoplasmalogenase family protein [Ardenticatenaceae bacterium]|nr:lysoplasmalogenase family protein [Ardenticatenaceae bacterium]